MRMTQLSAVLERLGKTPANEVIAFSGAHGLFTDYVVEALGTRHADIDGHGQISLKELNDGVNAA